MTEKNYFRNRIASEDNMKLFETTTHIEWDWRIETLAHIAVRLGMCFDIETDAVYLFTPIPEQKKLWTPYQKCSNKSQARRYDNINECLDYWKNLFPTYFSLGKNIDLWKQNIQSTDTP